MHRTFCRAIVALTIGSALARGADAPGPFRIIEEERYTRLVNELLALHLPHAFTGTTLWDAWLPHATLWTSPQARDRYRRVFLDRRIDEEGYVSVQQHRGLAHSEGWPFPTYQQASGKGWFFSVKHDNFAIAVTGLKPLSAAKNWQFQGAEIESFDPERGMILRAREDVVTITPPPIRCSTLVAPFMRLEWTAEGLAANAQPSLNWLVNEETEWRAEREVNFPAPKNPKGIRYANIPLYRQKGYQGTLKQVRIRVSGARNAVLILKSLHTAIDSRHPITNVNFLSGCADYVRWTGDVEFLRANMGRMRRALRYAIEEFGVVQHHHVRVPWVGHDGRSGLAIDDSGKIDMRRGLGVGNNYWDLLPFGGHDALATIYLFDALRAMAGLEDAIERHPEWNIPRAVKPWTSSALAQLARDVQADFRTQFWCPNQRRFIGWRDLTGQAYDYGFTFVNLEAIDYGLATPAQARDILAWLDGERLIPGDTARGDDIYHWRFAPRATTKRNIETYVWGWNRPDRIPWGDQVQDGGAVLGFSYFDLMARLKTQGPDAAWKRLKVILDWFEEVRDAGGYRSYYAQPGRGTLQGGGVAGGLGLDNEFLESVLVPQVMLYGFLGFQPGLETFQLDPRLPSGWRSLTVNHIHFHDKILDITVHADGRKVVNTRPAQGAPAKAK